MDTRMKIMAKAKSRWDVNPLRRPGGCPSSAGMGRP